MIIEWNGMSYDVKEEGEFTLYTSSPTYIPEQSEDGEGRSPEWHKVRLEAVKKNPFCLVCNCKKDLQVHHIKPFHLFPELELDSDNLVVLCRRDHFIFGHLFDWKSYNECVLDDIKLWKDKLRSKP